MIDQFPKIQRGNGIHNDNLATLSEIMLATYKGMKELKQELADTKEEVAGLSTTLSKIDKENTPREIKSFWLLVASVIIAAVGVVLMFFV